ncbi:hypothetical protein Bca52824_063641 [Brassica carinata]|uniref:Phosphoribosyltransferase domain-containing protein n=1 Tax=Brassica carinata TaxID=52824 RepID=A0A8X7U9D7_BRACI|nr:hypothetical protein Bca52824_063641 [Brassica carinata]
MKSNDKSTVSSDPITKKSNGKVSVSSAATIISFPGAKSLCNGIKIGKILTHRENNDGRQLIYEKLPKDIASLDHVLASGNSAVNALSLLISKGLIYEKLPKDIASLDHVLASGTSRDSAALKKHPLVLGVDASLNEDSRVIPGLGEFTDCYFAKNEGRRGALTVSQDKERIYGAKAMVKIYGDPATTFKSRQVAGHHRHNPPAQVAPQRSGESRRL